MDSRKAEGGDEAPKGVVVLAADVGLRSALGRALTGQAGLWSRAVADLDGLIRLCDIEPPAVVVCAPSGGRLAAARLAGQIRQRLWAHRPALAFVCDEVAPDLHEVLQTFGVDEVLVAAEAEARILGVVRRLALGAAAGDEDGFEAVDGPPRVFMIDDSRAMCMAVGVRLEGGSSGAEFGFVNDPDLALTSVVAFRPTVILLDLDMPGMSGFDLLGVLRDDPRTRAIPIIVLSGTTDPAVKANAFMHGADDYAEKAMDTIELNTRIAYHTRAHRNGQQLEASIRELREAKAQIEVQRDFVRMTFGRYLSDEIVSTLLERPHGLELGGERRTVSIMMADLREFTSMCEGLEPEDALSIVNNFLAVMTEVLIRYHGTIDEFIGDAILAIFGAPVQRPDDAQRAVACAVEMQLAMDRVNEWNRRAGFPDLGMGIGINTGAVVVGNIGSERRSKYGLVGSNVNLTSRIESATRAGQILISPATASACGPILRIDAELEIHPKGFEQSLTVLEVGGIGGEFNVELPR